MLQQFDAVHPGHLEIGESQIESAIFGKLDRCFTGCCCSYVVPFFGEDHFEDLSLSLFIVYDKNIFSRHVLEDIWSASLG